MLAVLNLSLRKDIHTWKKFLYDGVFGRGLWKESCYEAQAFPLQLSFSKMDHYFYMYDDPAAAHDHAVAAV